jgi:hypothetical protein
LSLKVVLPFTVSPVTEKVTESFVVEIVTKKLKERKGVSFTCLRYLTHFFANFDEVLGTHFDYAGIFIFWEY